MYSFPSHLEPKPRKGELIVTKPLMEQLGLFRLIRELQRHGRLLKTGDRDRDMDRDRDRDRDRDGGGAAPVTSLNFGE
jgi:hypothetical protein